jgi:hypothetical protein
MRRATLLIATMVLSLLLATGVALADTVIDTTPQHAGGAVCCFMADTTNTYGQVITAPANDTQLDSFTFLMATFGTVVFRGEVYAWDGEKATGPNLYESAPRTVSDSNGYEEVTFDTGGVQLIPGQQYVLFATITKEDSEASSGSSQWADVPGDAYAGGNFVYLDNGPFFDQLFTNAWYQFTDLDLAFRAVLSSLTPDTKEDCKNGGYKSFGFKTQGKCIKAVTHAS